VDTSDLAAINHAISIERAEADPAGSYDPEKPLDLHETHDWSEPGDSDSPQECLKCGSRDYWPAAERRCRLPGSSATSVTASAFRAQLRESLDAFLAWWRKAGHPDDLPSAAEWYANLLEWSRENPIDAARKVCGKCSEPKPLEAYHRSRAHRDGRQPHCKACRKGRGVAR